MVFMHSFTSQYVRINKERCSKLKIKAAVLFKRKKAGGRMLSQAYNQNILFIKYTMFLVQKGFQADKLSPPHLLVLKSLPGSKYLINKMVREPWTTMYWDFIIHWLFIF